MKALTISVSMLILFASVMLTDSSAREYKQTFPRIGCNYFAGKSYDLPLTQQNLARCDMASIGMFTFWNGGPHDTWQENQRAAIKAIKDINPNVIIFNYTNLQNARLNPDVIPWAGVFDKVTSETGPQGKRDWWLYENIVTGKLSDNRPYDQNKIVNMLQWTTPDANGDMYPQWLGKYNMANKFIPVPQMDGVFTDTVKYHPLYDADYDGDNKIDRWDNKDKMWVPYQQHFKAYWDTMKAIDPDRLQGGNIGSWAFSERSNCVRCLGEPIETGLPYFWQQLDMGLYEGFFGVRWSHNTYFGMDETLKMYNNLRGALKGPQLLMIGAHLDQAETTLEKVEKYQYVRYTMATTLMNDGYYAPSANKQYNVAHFQWFDEYDLAGTADTTWMGLAVDLPQLEPWQQGVYRREFQTGLALVNPKGNGKKTITLEPGWRRINGVQAPLINNGKLAITITMEERDGIILIREGQTPPIDPPDPGELQGPISSVI